MAEVGRCSGSLHIDITDSTIRYMRTEASLLLPIFRSANQARVLSEVFLVEERRSIRELSKKLVIPYATLHKEIGRLLDAGLIVEEKVGNYRLIAANRKSLYYKPMFELLEIAFGPVPKLRSAMREIPGISRVLIFGSWARRGLGHHGSLPHDIDVLVVGEPDVGKIYATCGRLTKELGWIMSPTIMTEDEWKTDTPFLRTVRKGGLISVIGETK